MLRRPEILLDAATLAALKVLVSLAVLWAGFTHVSDDDYSRTVIAETFAHAPRLDPSDTSWLPFPFWATGFAMMVFGRSLAVARVVSIGLAALASIAPYAGARALGVARMHALLATVILTCTPWSAWLGAATVPEGFSGLVTAGAILAIASPNRSTWAWGAAGLLVASLSRYESWPACAVAALAMAIRTVRSRKASDGAIAFACVLGPLAWMAWNAHAHDSAMHFFARVSTFRKLHAPAPLAERILGNLRALVTEFPEAVLIGAAGAIALRERSVREIWRLPLACAALTLLMLIVSDVRGGAPTHHPERALVPVAALLILFGVGASVPRVSKGIATTLSFAWTIATLFRVGGFPNDERSTQIRRGLELRGERVLNVTPCAYEHFALIAAYGAPENVTILPPGAAPMPECPLVAPPPK